MSRPTLFTLLFAFAAALLLVATLPGANALQARDLHPQFDRRADHLNVNQRMVKKKRAPAADDGSDVPINIVEDPNASTSSTQTASTPSASNGNNNGGRTSSASQTSSTGGLLDNLSSLLLGGQTSTTSASSATSTSSLSTSSATNSASATSTTPSSTRTTSRGTSLFVVTASVTPTESVSAAQDENASFLPKPVIIGLIVAGSCVVAAAAIWTVIRKWKFSPSRHFEDRLEPLNWQPTASSGVNNDHNPALAALSRTTSRNGGRPGSFHSGDDHGSVRNMTSTNADPISMAPDFPPAHDFTAGPANSGLGTSGYVDMHRGASPAPGQYGTYGGQYETPNPYDAYDYNNGYGQRRY